MSDEVKTHAGFVLPPSVVSRVDVSRLVSEAERVDNAMTAEDVRAKAGSVAHTAPLLSGTFAEFLEQNQLKLDNSHERSELVSQLRRLKDNVPIIHMTFASEADHESLGRLVAWLRESVHPQAVIDVGLQPGLVAGVYLRTPNHVHDLSLRAVIKEQHESLVSELGALRGAS